MYKDDVIIVTNFSKSCLFPCLNFLDLLEGKHQAGSFRKYFRFVRIQAKCFLS